MGGRISGSGCKQGLSPAGAGSAIWASITVPDDFMKRLGLHLCFLFLVLAFARSAADAAGHPLDTWHTRQPASDSGDLFGVCHGPGRFVAVGPNGTILTSSTGEIWSAHSSGSTVSLWAVTCGDGLFVAVGEAGMVLSSPDGMNWTTQASGVMTQLRAVQFGGGRFVVTGADNVILSGRGIRFNGCHPLDTARHPDRRSPADHGLWKWSFRHGKWRSDGLFPGRPSMDECPSRVLAP